MLKDAWSEILDLLQKNLSSGLYTVWIAPLDAEVSGETLLLKAPNEFVTSWVRDRVMDQIREAAAQILGQDVRVKIETRPKAAKPASAKAPALRITSEPPAKAAKPAPPVQMGLPILQIPGTQTNYRWRFRFDDFVVGPSNELAFAASRGVCASTLPSGRLFLSSAPGLGKTHLLHSIGKKLTDTANRDKVRIACLTAEEFATRFVLAMRAKELTRFKAGFREAVDVLLLEDVHFFQGKEKMQDELLATLRALHERGCKVVFTSSFLPKELEGLGSGLVSRLCSGVLARIDKPDYETRRRIVTAKARGMGADVPDDVTELLAERITTDIRQLESCLHNLVLKARLLGAKVNQNLAWDVLAQYNQTEAKPDFERIIAFVCKTYGLNERELASKSRKQQIVLARNTAFLLARRHTDMSLAAIGQRLGRQHSTVLKGITNLEREVSQQTPLGRQVQRTVESLTS